jgi:DNA-binding HxlR family transcriptional regulator
VLTCVREGRRTHHALTPMGDELGELCLSLGVWGARWCAAHAADQDP